MPSIIFDLEANSKAIATVSTIWCLSYTYLGDTVSDEPVKTITARGIEDKIPSMYKQIKDRFPAGTTLIGHNIIAYDLPVLAKLVFKCPVEELYKRYKIIDTLVISRAQDADRETGHSLESYAKLFGGEQKVQQTTWDKWDDNYLKRCPSDVRLTYKVLKYLEKERVKLESYTT